MDTLEQASKTYSFTLILSGVSELTEELENSLFEAGCDDALLGIQDGVVYLDFDREADSFHDAMLSAFHQVESSTPGIRVIRVEPDDFVTAAEIARRSERSRESIRLLLAGKRGPGGFPTPVSSLTTQSSLWKWSEVAEWFTENGLMKEPLARNAVEIATINSCLDLRRNVRTKKGLLELWDSLTAAKTK